MAKARQTKTDKVHKMLTRPQGASLDKICAATGWQPHSARAALSVLRKAGRVRQIKATEPAISQVQMHLFAQPAL